MLLKIFAAIGAGGSVLHTLIAGQTGNALENVAESFPGCRFLEYHFPGLEPKNEGFDWCSLKLVLSPYQGEWRLVGLIHSEWTT